MATTEPYAVSLGALPILTIGAHLLWRRWFYGELVRAEFEDFYGRQRGLGRLIGADAGRFVHRVQNFRSFDVLRRASASAAARCQHLDRPLREGRILGLEVGVSRQPRCALAAGAALFAHHRGIGAFVAGFLVFEQHFSGR